MTSTELGLVSENTLLSRIMSNDITEVLSFAKEFLPTSFLGRLGCMHCEWRFSAKCDYSNITESGQASTCYPKEGICINRLRFIMSLLPSYDEQPSEDQIYRDLTLNMGSLQNLKEFNMLQDYQDRYDLEIKKDEPDAKLIKHLQFNIDKMWGKYTQHMDKLLKSREKGLDRVNPRKHEHTHMNIDLAVMQKFMRDDFQSDKVIDIDVDDKNE